MIGTPQHTISVIVDGHQIEGWSTYRFSASITRPANPFSVRIPFSRDVWDICRTDRRIKVLIDDVVVLTGFIDERLVSEDDESVEIIGRDLTGRLVQESAPGINFSGLGVKDLVKKLAAPWFTEVVFSNERNRRILRGRGGKSKGHKKGTTFTGRTKVARADGDALRLNTRVGTQIEPGQARWQVIETLCAQAGYIAWSSGDGKELIVGAPDYDQDIQFVFFMPAANSKRIDESTVLGLGVRDSTGDRYSRVICVGSGTGTDANYGLAVSARYGESRNNPDTVDGDGKDFSEPKRLIVTRSVHSIAEATELADREMNRRDAQGHLITVRCAGHGQVYSGSQPTLFAPDTLALVEDERTGTAGIYLITDCSYQSGRTGEETVMTLIRSGSELTAI